MMDAETLANLALAADTAKRYNWAELSLDKETAYIAMAEHILGLGDDINVVRCIATHLLASHFILNCQLELAKKQNKD